MLLSTPPLRRVALAGLLLALAAPLAGHAQAPPSWTSATSLNALPLNSNTSTVTGIAVDAAGNEYVTGYFTGNLVLGSIGLNAVNGADLFVAKHNVATDTWLWGRSAGGTGADKGAGIAVDASGNVIITGTYAHTITLQPSPTLQTLGGPDTYVAKFDGATGMGQWAVSAGRSTLDETTSTGVAVDGNGNAIVTGYFSSSATFATTPATTLTSTGAPDSYVAKFAAATGACQWAVQAGGSGYLFANGVAVDAAGDAIVTGSYEDTVTFPTVPTTTLGSAGVQNVFVAKFAGTTGASLWATGTRGNGEASGNAVAIDQQGDALVTGRFMAPTLFPGSPSFNLMGAGDNDVFVAKLAGATGACQWVGRAGGFNSEVAYGIGLDGSGNAVVTGAFSGNSSFPTTPVTSLIGLGNSDLFVARFDGATGACQWATSAGGTNSDQGLGVQLDSRGDAHVTGSFYSFATFGTIPLTGDATTGFVAVHVGAGSPLHVATEAVRQPIRLLPNPATAGTVRVTGGAAGQPLTLLDLTGRLLAQHTTAHDGSTTLSLTGLPPGVYVVRCGGQIQRLVVE